jgi:hypothetical protein
MEKVQKNSVNSVQHTPSSESFQVYLSVLNSLITRMEAGSNTSTVNLRVVRGDEMGLKKAAP